MLVAPLPARLLGAFALLICSFGFDTIATAEDVPTWKAGVAAVKITPDKPMWMSGYGSRDHPAEGTLAELWAKAVVIEDPAAHRIALVSINLVGIDRDLSIRVRDRLKERYKLDRADVALCSSHTHSGPVVGHNLIGMYPLDETQRKLIADYTAGLEDKLVSVVGNALKTIAPVKIGWAVGSSSFAVNRRNNPEGEVPKRKSEGALKGPVDHDLPVMAIREPGGKLRAVLFGYACHATTLNINQWSNDWPGFAEEDLQQKHPGALALFWAGCGADQNPLPRRSIQLCKSYGQQAATDVEKAMGSEQSPLKPLAGSINTAYSEIDLSFAQLPSREMLEKDATSKDVATAARARALLQTLKRDGKLNATYPYPVQVWKMGTELKWVLLGGEVVVDYSLRLKKELGDSSTWIAAYTNDVMAYIPSKRVLTEGGYEGGLAMVYYGLPAPWAADVEERIIAEVTRLAGNDPPAGK